MSTDITNLHYKKVILAVPNIIFPFYCIAIVTKEVLGELA